jgi:hypothetical protein
MAALAPVSIVAFVWVSSSGSTAMYVFENTTAAAPVGAAPHAMARGAGIAALVVVIVLM